MRRHRSSKSQRVVENNKRNYMNGPLRPVPPVSVRIRQHISSSEVHAQLWSDHIRLSLTAAPFVLAARLTVVLPSERPELCGSHGIGTRTGLVSCLSSQHRRLRPPHLLGSGQPM